MKMLDLHMAQFIAYHIILIEFLRVSVGLSDGMNEGTLDGMNEGTIEILGTKLGASDGMHASGSKLEQPL